jgi:hypothetical protein
MNKRLKSGDRVVPITSVSGCTRCIGRARMEGSELCRECDGYDSLIGFEVLV